MKILIVDDSKAVVAFVKDLLSVFDVQLKIAVNGAEAINFLKSDGTFDLVLMDWEMPLVNGPTAVRQIRSLGFKHKIVMMTTRNNPDDVSYILSLGADEYIMKPFTRDILVSKLEWLGVSIPEKSAHAG